MSRNALAALEHSGKTLKRAQYEGFEFSIESPGSVRVTNASYGAEKDDHSYLVDVDDGVPIACGCPADEHHSGACKHRVAVAIRAPIVEAASADQPDERPAMADGGAVVAPEPQGSTAEDGPAHAEGCDNPECEGLAEATERPLLSFECWDVWASPEGRR